MFGSLPDSEVNDTALGFTERQFWFTAGNAYTSLGMIAEANEVQERAMAMYRRTEYLDPALIRLDQAAGLATSRNYNEACQLATHTIVSAPEQHRSGLITHCGWRFLHHLPAATRAIPAAKELEEVLRNA